MDVDHNTEPESSSTYESTTTVDSDDDTTSSNHQNDKFVPPKIHRMSSSSRADQNYAEFVKSFQLRLITINFEGNQEDLLNFLDHFWEKLKRERNVCFTKSKATKFLCRRLNHVLITVRDINRHYVYNPIYFCKVSRILAVYLDLELKSSSRGTEYGVAIIERMQYMLCSHQKSPSHQHDDEFILQAFIHMERLIKAHKELVDMLFNRFIKPKSEVFDPKIFTDRIYITYLVLYRKWIDIETSAEFKKKIVEMSKKHILPASSLRKNLKYAPFLSNWTPNQNPTELFLTNRMKFSPLIEALKVPDIEDNSDIEIIDFQNMTNLLDETQANDSTISITNFMSSTSISNAKPGDQVNDTLKSDNSKKSSIFDKTSTSSSATETLKTSEPAVIKPKQEPIDACLDQDDIIDLTLDEIDVGNFEDSHLAWISVIEQKAKCSLMLPPQNYGVRKVCDKIIVLDDDDDDSIDAGDESKKPKLNTDSENSLDNNLNNFLGKIQTIETSPKNNSSAVNGNSGYSITSPTDSGIIMNNSGRNTVCSLYDEELTDCGLTSNDEHDPKQNKSSNNIATPSKSNFINTDTEVEIETDTEIENLTKKTLLNQEAAASIDNIKERKLVNTNVDKINDNCDEIVINNQNIELLKTIETKLSENNVTDSKNMLRQVKLRCGPITKTYQSNKKPRTRILTPTLDIVNSTTGSSPILMSPCKSEITLNDNSIVSKSIKTQTIKALQSNTSSTSGNNTNTGAVVFSMLPRQKPNVSSHLSNATTSPISNPPISSNNVVFSTLIPNTTEPSKSLSSTIIKDWTKTTDDEVFRIDGGIESDVEEDDIPPSNILIRCDYFKTEKPSASPFSTRAVSPNPMPIGSTCCHEKISTTSSKNSPFGKNVFTVRKSPEPKILRRPPSRNKRVAFANSLVEYKTEKVEDEKNDLKIRIKKQTTSTRRPPTPVKKSILKKQPKPMPCSVVLNKLPVSNKHVGEYIETIENESKPERVASILIRRNSVHSTNAPCDINKDEEYTVWRRDYTTDDNQTEQRKSRRKKKSKRKRSRSLIETHSNTKKRKQEIYRLPPIKQLSIKLTPLNLSQLIVDPEIDIQFENELENDNEIYNSFESNAFKTYVSTPKSNIVSPSISDHNEDNNVINPLEFNAVDDNDLIDDEEIVDDHVSVDQDMEHENVNDHDPIEPVDLLQEDNTDENVNDHDPIEPVDLLQEDDMDENVNDHDPIEPVDLVQEDDTEINCEPPRESQIYEESTVLNELHFTSDLNSNDDDDDETVVSTTNEIQEEIETEIVIESIEHEVVEETIDETNESETVDETNESETIDETNESEPVDETNESEPVDETNESETVDETNEIESMEINKKIIDYSEPNELVISKSPECEHNSLNISGSSEEIMDTNKIMSDGSDQATETFLDRLNVSGTSDEIHSTDINNVNDTPKSIEQLNIIARMLSKKPAKVLKANSCLDQISNSKTLTKIDNSKNGEQKNGRDSLEIDEDIQNDSNKNVVIDVKSSPTNTGEDEFLMEEYIDDEEIVVAAAIVVELNNNRSEGDQSCASEEIPSPPFETVIPKLGEQVDVSSKKVKLSAAPHSHLNEDVPIESPPFDEVLDLKSFGTLENDSSISEMENVGKRVNDNFNEIDEEDENALSENEIDLNADIESSNLPDTKINTSNQNDVTTTTLSSVQKKKNLVQRPYNRHIKINNKKRSSNSNSSGSDIPETIVSSTTITTNHLVAIANQVEFNGTNNSSTTYNLFCQLNHEDYKMKRRPGRPKGSKNKRKDIPPQMSPSFKPDLFQYSPLSPPPPPLKHVHRRQSVFYQHHEIASSSSAPRPMLFNNNPPYRPPYNAPEESLNQINRNRSLPIQPFNRHQRINYRSPSCDSDEQPLIHLKHHQPSPSRHHPYERKHKKLKRNDSESPPFSLEKQFGSEKDLLDATKTYMKVQEARTIFVPEDIDKLIQNQTPVDPSMIPSPITTTYHRYDPSGGAGICANHILNNSSSSSLSDPITQSHQFVNYDTSSSPDRITTLHEHNYSNDSFPHQLPQALLNTSSLDYLHLPYLLTAQQQFKTPLQYIHR